MAVVLVINDDDAMMDTYESVLTSLGHDPVTKLTVASGPETVRDVGADVLLVDLRRPGDDEYGLRIIEELRADEITRAFPIVLCTGATAAVASMRLRLNELAVPIMIKPFSIKELEATLNTALEHSGKR